MVETNTQLDEELKTIFSNDQLWVTIVWDDPVNLMSYVTFVFMEIFSYNKSHATELMLKVHNHGKAVVSNGAREEMERYVQRLHEYGLWATISKESI